MVSGQETEIQFKEIPQSGFTAVIADDEPHVAKYTEQSIRTALASLNISPDSIQYADTIEKLLAMSLKGKEGNQVDAIFLDSYYGNHMSAWSFTAKGLLQAALEYGVDLSPFQTLEHELVPGMAGNINEPNSVNFAILLRILGFNGNIFVTSGDPPDPNKFIQKLNEIREKVPTYQPMFFPVNGIVKKDSLGTDPKHVNWAREINNERFRWDKNFTPLGFTQGLIGLLSYRPS